MATATPAAIRQQIAAGTLDPIYVIQGEDELEKGALALEFVDGVDEGLRVFNVDRLHAGEWTTGDRLAAGVQNLLAAAQTLPMMAPRRVVMVQQAEVLVAPKRESEAASRALDAFEAYLEAPEPLTALVLIAAPLDKRSRLYKLLLKVATFVPCGLLEDQADAERWVRARVAAAGAALEPAAARLLAERAGTDVVRLRGEVDRLLLYALGQKTITAEDARQVAGPAALQDHVGADQRGGAGRGAGGAAAARAGVRRGRGARAGARPAGVGGAVEISAGRDRPGRRGRVPDRSRAQAQQPVERPAADAARAADRGIVREAQTVVRAIRPARYAADFEDSRCVSRDLWRLAAF